MNEWKRSRWLLYISCSFFSPLSLTWRCNFVSSVFLVHFAFGRVAFYFYPVRPIQRSNEAHPLAFSAQSTFYFCLTKSPEQKNKKKTCCEIQTENMFNGFPSLRPAMSQRLELINKLPRSCTNHLLLIYFRKKFIHSLRPNPVRAKNTNSLYAPSTYPNGCRCRCDCLCIRSKEVIKICLSRIWSVVSATECRLKQIKIRKTTHVSHC